jgi:hypothetical protein
MNKEALEAFRRCVHAGYHHARWSTQDPDLAILHADPEFLKLASEGDQKVSASHEQPAMPIAT